MYNIIKARAKNGYHIKRKDGTLMPNIKGKDAIFTLDAAHAIVLELNRSIDPIKSAFNDVFGAFIK